MQHTSMLCLRVALRDIAKPRRYYALRCRTMPLRCSDLRYYDQLCHCIAKRFLALSARHYALSRFADACACIDMGITVALGSLLHVVIWAAPRASGLHRIRNPLQGVCDSLQIDRHAVLPRSHLLQGVREFIQATRQARQGVSRPQFYIIHPPFPSSCQNTPLPLCRQAPRMLR